MNTLDNIKISNKKIIFRADLNVPVVNGKITDHSRIESLIPSIHYLKKNGNKIFIVAHFGRPKGKVNEKLSLKFLCEEIKIRSNSLMICARCGNRKRSCVSLFPCVNSIKIS